ncbi:hypothetical protein ACFPM7_05740 [Actinokineospora guangxiensis]|uniref:Uncharacterized protein n=1 Tax=Actinokineospora guangxiensis TaxID=1490288 RepID=A0ABW0EGM3_9PSEU
MTAILAAPSDTTQIVSAEIVSAEIVSAWKETRFRVAGSGAADGHPAGQLRLPELGGRVSRANALAGFAAGAAMSMPVYPTLTLAVTAWPR